MSHQHPLGDSRLAQLCRDAWFELLMEMRCTHSFTLSPQIPGLCAEEAFRLGEMLAKRLKDRAGLHSGSIVMFPERCPSGLWHYHGVVVAVRTCEQEHLDSVAEIVMTDAMAKQAVRKYGRSLHGPTHSRPSSRFERIRGCPAQAVHYAMKRWRFEGKEGTVIYI